MATATLRSDPGMEVDAALRDPALLAEVSRLWQLLQIEGRKGSVGSNGPHSGASAAYLALEDQIREASWRYRQSAITTPR